MRREPNKTERTFMLHIHRGWRMPPATREQDRARQWCRQHGYAYYAASKWALTEKGREYMRQYDTEAGEAGRW